MRVTHLTDGPICGSAVYPSIRLWKPSSKITQGPDFADFKGPFLRYMCTMIYIAAMERAWVLLYCILLQPLSKTVCVELREGATDVQQMRSGQKGA